MLSVSSSTYNTQAAFSRSPPPPNGLGLATLSARTVHEQLKAVMHAVTPVCQPPPAYLPALPASPFAETQLQPQQHVSPPGSPTPAVAQLMRSLTLSGTAQPPSPTSSGSSAAAATAMLGITPACAEALAPVSCSSKLVSVPSSAACPANGLGPAPASDDGLQLCAQHLRAKLAEQAQQAQRGMAATLLQQQALAPRARAMLPQPTAAAAQGDSFNDTFLTGSTLAADSPAGLGQQQGFQQHMQVVSALLLQPQGEQPPSAVYQAGSLAPTARLGASTISTQPHGAGSGAPGACRSSLPLLQGPKGWADFKPSRASLAGAHSVQQAQQAALHTAAQALLMHQLPAHLQVQALLQQQQQLQLQSVAARLWQQGAHNPRHMPHAQHSMKRQVAGPLASQPPKHAEPNDPPESLLGIDGRYQPYCQQVITPRLNQAAACALAAVKLLQAGDAPTPHLAHGKRFFCSLKEVAKVVPAAKCLIVAPDVRISPTAHINPVAALQRILRAAEACNVPIVFALSRRGIGQVFGRDKSMSIVAIMHLEGLEGHFDVMLQEAIKGRQLFKQYCAGTALAASHHSGTLNAALLHHGGAEYAATGTYRGPPGAFPYSEAATALLHQGLPNLQPFLSTLFN